MFHQNEVLRSLTEVDILEAVKWAFESAVRRSLETYDEKDGHDGMWLGTTRYVLFRNRLDRVFSCQQYTTASVQDKKSDEERLVRLSDLDRKTMPTIPAGLVNRANLCNSPGWSYKGIQFLLASAEFRKIENIRWSGKSSTKESVSKIPVPDPAQPPLVFEDCDGVSQPVFVVAHSLEYISRRTELVFGKPRDNHEGGAAWEWTKYLIEAATTPDIQPQPLDLPRQSAAENIPDAPVRLRNKTDEQHDGSTGELK